MKLPPEVERDFWLPTNAWELAFVEALVRDCAKVCFDAADEAEKELAHLLAVLLRHKGNAILARYGLEPK